MLYLQNDKNWRYNAVKYEVNSHAYTIIISMTWSARLCALFTLLFHFLYCERRSVSRAPHSNETGTNRAPRAQPTRSMATLTLRKYMIIICNLFELVGCNASLLRWTRRQINPADKIGIYGMMRRKVARVKAAYRDLQHREITYILCGRSPGWPTTW